MQFIGLHMAKNFRNEVEPKEKNDSDVGTGSISQSFQASLLKLLPSHH
jgi:hypothetical protein